MSETTVQAADRVAHETLARVEAMSPLATRSLQGPMRDVVLAAMAMCFTEGTVWGAQRMIEGFRDSHRVEVLPAPKRRASAEAAQRAPNEEPGRTLEY
jgi:hypothetical protein